MNRRFYPFLLVFALFAYSNTPANSFTTSSSGYWNSAFSWQNGQIPSLSGNDTIYIIHDIFFQQDLNLLPNTILTIYNNGSLCGHYHVSIPGGSILYNYGGFYSDTVSLPGGHLFNYSSGDMIVQYWGVINNGGSWSNMGGSLQVGASFTCGGKTIGINEESVSDIRIYPQPVNSNTTLYIELPDANAPAEIQILTVSGEKCGQFSLVNGSVKLNNLPAGYYILLIRQNEKNYHSPIILTD